MIMTFLQSCSNLIVLKDDFVVTVVVVVVVTAVVVEVVVYGVGLMDIVVNVAFVVLLLLYP